MILSDDEIQQFIDLYEVECGERLSKHEATEIAWRLVDLYAFLVEPLSSEQTAPPTPPSGEAGSRIPS